MSCNMLCDLDYTTVRVGDIFQTNGGHRWKVILVSDNTIQIQLLEGV